MCLRSLLGQRYELFPAEQASVTVVTVASRCQLSRKMSSFGESSNTDGVTSDQPMLREHLGLARDLGLTRERKSSYCEVGFYILCSHDLEPAQFFCTVLYEMRFLFFTISQIVQLLAADNEKGCM